MASFDLGPSVSKLLRSCAALSDAQLASTTQAVVSAVCGGQSAEQAAAGAASSPARDAVAALAALVTHAACLDLTGDQLKAALRDDHGWSDAHASGVAATYEASRPSLRAVLARTAAAGPAPVLVGCHWRADLVVGGSNCLGGPPQPVFHLTLVTRPTAGTAAGAPSGYASLDAVPEGRLCMRLDVEQLQELSFSLKEALRAAQRAASREVGGDA